MSNVPLNQGSWYRVAISIRGNPITLLWEESNMMTL